MELQKWAGAQVREMLHNIYGYEQRLVWAYLRYSEKRDSTGIEGAGRHRARRGDSSERRTRGCAEAKRLWFSGEKESLERQWKILAAFYASAGA